MARYFRHYSGPVTRFKPRVIDMRAVLADLAGKIGFAAGWRDAVAAADAGDSAPFCRLPRWERGFLVDSIPDLAAKVPTESIPVSFYAEPHEAVPTP